MPREPIDPVTRSRVIGCAFAAAILSAPFIALLYGRQVGLGVMAVALGAVAYLVWDARSHAAAAMQPRLTILAAVNLALALVMVLVLIIIR